MKGKSQLAFSRKLKQPPNIIMIVMDAARYDHLSVYGYKRNTTPFLANLASRGQIYLNCFASSVWTVPSHASLFTGKYVYEHGMYGRHLKLNSRFPTLAQKLHEAGYETVMATANALLSRTTGLTRGFDKEWRFRGLTPDHPLAGYKILNQFVTKSRLEWYQDKGATWINKQVKRWNQKRSTTAPFFLFINYLDAHLPYKPPKACRRQFLDATKETEAEKINQDPLAQFAGKSNLTEEDFSILIDLYDAELCYVDSKIEELHHIFEQSGLNQNTVWIITSDHGENIGEHNLMDHQFSILDTLAHVPLIIHAPALVPEKIPYLVQQQDLYEWAQQVAKGTNGNSFLPERKYCLYEYLYPPLMTFTQAKIPVYNVEKASRNYRAIRTANYKLVEINHFDYRLYDMRRDSPEDTDIAFEQPENVHRLQKILMNHPFKQEQKAFLDEEEQQNIEDHLRALGYM